MSNSENPSTDSKLVSSSPKPRRTKIRSSYYDARHKSGYNMEDIWNLAIKFKKDWKRIAIEYEKKNQKVIDGEELRKLFKQFPRPKLIGQKFSDFEDEKLLDLINSKGFDWIGISENFPGRCPLSLRNRYYSLTKNNKVIKYRNSRNLTEFSLNKLCKDIVFENNPPFLDLIESLTQSDSY